MVEGKRMGAREGLGASVLAGFYPNVAAAGPAGDGRDGGLWPTWEEGELPTTRAGLLTSLGVIGRAIYSPGRSVPVAADKNTDEPPFCC